MAAELSIDSLSVSISPPTNEIIDDKENDELLEKKSTNPAPVAPPINTPMPNYTSTSSISNNLNNNLSAPAMTALSTSATTPTPTTTTTTTSTAAKRTASPSPNTSDSNKRSRVPSPPSKVIHLRNLPHDILDAHVAALFAPFGQLQAMLVMQNKGQALVQFELLESASAALSYYEASPPHFQGREVYMQYSSHQQLKTTNNNNNNNNSNNNNGSNGGGVDGNQAMNHVLLVTIDQAVYAINVDMLHVLFSRFGHVVKIVIFSKPNQAPLRVQALIQFSDATSANNARQMLDGQTMAPNCCSMRIVFSNLSDITVKRNDDRSRDFRLAPPHAAAGAAVAHPPAQLSSPPMLHAYSTPYPSTSALAPQLQITGCVLLVSGFTPNLTSPDDLFTLFGVYGNVTRVKILFTKQDTALVQFSEPLFANTAMQYLHNAPFRGGTLRVNHSHHKSIALPREDGEDQAALTRDYSQSNLHRFRSASSKNFRHICAPSKVLHLSSIPSETKEQDLRNLFTQYGTVVNFKWFTDSKMALLELSTLNEAVEALVGLHNVALNADDSRLRVSFSTKSI